MSRKESFSNSIQGSRCDGGAASSGVHQRVKELHGSRAGQFSASTGSTSWNQWIASPDLQADIGGRSRSRPRRDLQIDWTADRMIGLSMKASSHTKVSPIHRLIVFLRTSVLINRGNSKRLSK